MSSITKTVTMWGLFWKGTSVLACRRLYHSRAATSAALPYRYSDWWRAATVDERLDVMGWERRPVFSSEFSEVKP